MIQLQVLNYILQTRSLELVHTHQITEAYFPAYQPEFSFVMAHFTRHGSVPDPETFVQQFPDFDLFSVHEPESYLVDALHEEYLFSLIPPLTEKLQTLAERDSREAVKFLLDSVQKLSTVATLSVGYDVARRAQERLQSYQKRAELEGLLGITSGYKEIDQALHGWLDLGDLIIVGARTNEGKSWIMEAFAKNAWLGLIEPTKEIMPRKRILYYSGEMASELMAFRFDTLYAHFSNRALLSGDPAMSKDSEGYAEYMRRLSQDDVPFVIVTPRELGKRLDVPTLRSLVARHKSDMVFVDQLTLMEDSRGQRYDPKNQKLGNITADLRELSNTTRVPIMAAHQIRRNNTGRRIDPEDIPELDDLYMSDEIAHNATRVLMIRQVPGHELKLVVRKNTFGERDLQFLFSWDIDLGILQSKLTSSSASSPYGGEDEGAEIF